jgi:hypothetical protein
MTKGLPTQDENGNVVGSTLFERLGQKGVKDTRCYSLSITHQVPRGLVGPTAGAKIYPKERDENQKIRQMLVDTHTKASMEILTSVATPAHMALLEENALFNNIPRVGDPTNVAFVALQLNNATAVSYVESTS